MTTNARQQIRETADANGWTLHEDSTIGTEYRKGRRHVFLTFRTNGAVHTASTHRGRITGTDKAPRVLTALRNA